MKKALSLICSVLIACTAFSGCADKNNLNSTANAPEINIADNSIDFAKSLKFGWNLGNTLEATAEDGLAAETSWGQTRTTKELFDYLKELGFTSVRLPVTWGIHIDENNKIDPEWMARVTEVVNYAIEDGFYVILNSHHDCDKYFPTEENYADAESFIKEIWTQISENFKDYDERLVFESMNEPRLMNTEKEWWAAEDDEDIIQSIKCIVKLNQVFVDTVRAGGGYNSTRFLMVPSNAASPANALNKNFEMPNDSANRLMLSIHAYMPNTFALNGKGTDKWTESRADHDFEFMDKLAEKFANNGYGIVIGEFGATNKDNISDRVTWAKAYTGKTARLGIPCFVWDNGAIGVGAEKFGLIDRRNFKVFFPELLDAYLESYK